MRVGIVHMLVVSALSLSLPGRLVGAEGDAPKPGPKPAEAPRREYSGGAASAILQNAEALGLTPEQKAKLEEMAKGPMSVLTEEQKTKFREILTKLRQERGAQVGTRPGVPPRPGVARPDAPPAAPKPEEKK